MPSFIQPFLFMLFQIGAVVDHKDGNNLTALHHACMDAKYECVQVLLRSGADINIKDKVRSICVLGIQVKVTFIYRNLTSWSRSHLILKINSMIIINFKVKMIFFVNIILYLRLITFLESDNLTNLIFKKNCMEKV